MGTAPVADAAMRGDRVAVTTLLKSGADVSVPHGDGMTALHWAASRGDVELARTLIASGAPVNATTRIDKQTPLHVAGSKGEAAIVRLLLSAGANVNATTVVGTTPLMLAAAAGPADAVTALLAGGADPNLKEVAKYHTALMFAAAANRTEAVKALLKGGADSSATTKVFDLMVVDVSADWNTLNNADSKARQAAAAAGAPGEKGAGMRPLEFNELVAAQGGLTALNLAARQGYRDTAAALIAGGADVNQVSAGVQLSPLLIAIINGQFDLAVDLLDKGADPNVTSENGVAPLYAVLGCRWSMKAQYPQPRAFLQQKTSHVELLKILLDHGALPNTRLKKKVWYNGYTQDTTGIDEAGATAFWRAAHASDVPAMRVLLAGGADPSLPTKPTNTRPGPADDPDTVVGPGVSPLLAASGAGFLQAFAGNGRRGDAAGWLPAVRYLVDELHADVNQRDHDGNTALHYAAARGDNEMVNYLVSKGADVKAINRRGQTTVDAANGPRQRINPFPETIEILEKLGAKNNHQCVSC